MSLWDALAWYGAFSLISTALVLLYLYLSTRRDNENSDGGEQ